MHTYVPLSAGIAAMPYRRFITMNVIGAVSWVVPVTFVGVALGNIPRIAHSIDLIMILIFFISVLPIIIPALMKRRKNPVKIRVAEDQQA
ncbi:DedA family protein [Corynebacterium gerontici]|uniref:SNARE associated Golgi protein n=1 Tax=Corynebacterium gerontici TaxID=2079234 RepID=A0A3G6J582_9CORY|nr:hypothetical protein CGERO_04385 [Corynebacterium gerontici]